MAPEKLAGRHDDGKKNMHVGYGTTLQGYEAGLVSGQGSIRLSENEYAR